MKKALLIACVGFLLSSCTAPVEIVDAPEFDLELISGGQLSSEELKGKVVVVDFWATWCAPCIVEIPHYNELAKKMADEDVEIVGITLQSGSIDEVRAQAAEFGIEYPIVMGDDNVANGFGAGYAFPMTFVLGRDWTIHKKFLGTPPGKNEEMEELIAYLLEEPALPGAPAQLDVQSE